MLAMLRAISASVSSGRDSSRKEGSPTREVPPPISTMGLWPLCCSTRSIMIESRWPTCSESAVQS